VASELIIQVYSWMFDNLRHSQNCAATLPYVNYKFSSDIMICMSMVLLVTEASQYEL
jgi:hypothetical protein